MLEYLAAKNIGRIIYEALLFKKATHMELKDAIELIPGIDDYSKRKFIYILYAHDIIDIQNGIIKITNEELFNDDY